MRGWSQAFRDAIEANKLAWAMLVDLDFASGVQRVWSGPLGTAITWQGNTYVGTGDLGSIDKLSESADLSDNRTVLRLRVTPEQVDTLELEDTTGRSATLRIVAFDETGQIADEFVTVMRMGALRVKATRQGDEVVEHIELELHSPAAIFGRSHVVGMTLEAAKRIDSADWGLEYVDNPSVHDTGVVSDRRGGGGGYGGGRASGGVWWDTQRQFLE